MSLPAYPEYRATGHHWLRVPAHWDLRSLAQCGRFLKGSGGSKADIAEEGLPCVRYGDLYTTHEFFIHRSRTLIAETAKALYFPIQYGDLLFAASGETFEDIGRSAVNLMHGEAYCGGDIVILRPSPGVDIRFLAYAADSLSARQQKASQGRGTTVKHIYPEQLARIVVAVPTADEQAGIVRFLECETARVDALVAEQERLIELLKEKRQAVISHAVTKGIRADVPMKHSGVTWIGEIPAHWGVVQSRRLFRVRNEPARDSDRQLTASQKYGMVFQSDFVEMEGRRVVEVIHGTDSLRHAEPNDFVISLRSFQGGLEWCKTAGSVTFHYVVIVPVKHVHEPFFAYLFKSATYIQALRSTANLIRDGQDLRYSHFVLVDFPLVPLDEQEEIAAYLDRETAQIDALVSDAQRAITLLRERRVALISAAVTGQIDVRAQVTGPQAARKPYSSGFARQILAAEILNRFHSHPTMGRVKLQKLIHLCEYVGQIEEVHGDYRRQAAGPFDQGLMFGVVKALSGQQWFSERREAKGSPYVPLAKAGGHSKYLARWQDRMPAIEKVLQLLGTQTSERCEIVSTLYAAWNDLLIEGRTPSDSEIIREATELWHASKAGIAFERWPKALDWMRKHDLIPTGFGAHTRRATTAAKDDA